MNKWEKLNKLYIDKNLKIFPVVKNGKTPLVTEWNQCCSSNYQQLLYRPKLYKEACDKLTWFYKCGREDYHKIGTGNSRQRKTNIFV